MTASTNLGGGGGEAQVKHEMLPFATISQMKAILSADESFMSGANTDPQYFKVTGDIL